MMFKRLSAPLFAIALTYSTALTAHSPTPEDAGITLAMIRYAMDTCGLLERELPNGLARYLQLAGQKDFGGFQSAYDQSFKDLTKDDDTPIVKNVKCTVLVGSLRMMFQSLTPANRQ